MRATIILSILFCLLTSAIEPDKIAFEDIPGNPHYAKQAYIGIPLMVDSANGTINKVLFRCGVLEIEVEKTEDHIRYIPQKLLGNKLNVDKVDFKIDSVRLFTSESAPCIILGSELTGSDFDVRITPFTHAKYNDSRLNDFPIEVLHQNSYRAFAPNGEPITLHCSSVDSTWVILTPNESNGIRNGKKFKPSYSVEDTIHLKDDSYVVKLEELHHRLIGLTMDRVNSSQKSFKLSQNVMDELHGYFGTKDLLLLDFSGSWCAPCIEALKDTKLNYNEANDDYSILTIFCEIDNDYSNAQQLWNEGAYSWNVKYETLGAGLNRAFKVESFPRFFLIDREGSIISEWNSLYHPSM